MRKRALSVILCICTITCLLANVAFCMDKQITLNHIETNYSKALSIYKEATHNSTASFYGNCGDCVSFQLQALGISSLRYNGNDMYDTFAAMSSTNGYTINAYPAANMSISDLKSFLDYMNQQNSRGDYTYIAIGFQKGSDSENGRKYGHTCLIYQVYDGMVYSADTDSRIHRDYCTGIVSTIDDFCKMYNYMTYEGSIWFNRHDFTFDPENELCRCGEKYVAPQETINTKCEVIVNNAQIRSKPYQDYGKTLAKVKAGTMVTVDSSYLNVFGNTWYKVSYKDSTNKTVTGYMYSSKLKMPEVDSKLSINLNKWPESVKLKDSFNLQGSITSEKTITKVEGRILDASGQVWLSSVDQPNSTKMNIGTANLNYNLKFGLLPVGNYTLEIKATDAVKSKTESKTFTVFSNQTATPQAATSTNAGTTSARVDSTLKINLSKYPTTLNKGSSYNLQGSVDSNYAILKVIGEVKDASGKTVLSSQDQPNSTKMNISSARLNYDLKFGTLGAGNYTMVVTAVDKSGKTATATKSFTVAGSAANTVLRSGSSGSAVKELQQNLNKLIGAGLTVDGIFGNDTKKAVQTFQSKYGLTVDGIAGPITPGKIDSLLASGTATQSSTTTKKPISNPDQILRNGSSGNAVKELQQSLNTLMGAGLTVDGIYGNATAAAVKSFQQKYGLEADGIAGPKTLNKINSLF